MGSWLIMNSPCGLLRKEFIIPIYDEQLEFSEQEGVLNGRSTLGSLVVWVRQSETATRG